MRNAERRPLRLAGLAAGALAVFATFVSASPDPLLQARPDPSPPAKPVAGPASTTVQPSQAASAAATAPSSTGSPRVSQSAQPSRASSAAAPADSSLASQQAPQSAPSETPPPAVEVPQPFVATYAIEWRGMGAGTSTIELTKTGPQDFRYRSSNAARGIFRIALPGTIMQTSDLSIAHGEVVPRSFTAEDGSSGTERDIDLKFDWETRRVSGTAEDEPVDLPIEPGVQDPGSVQIALMRELAAGRSPESFMMVDKDEVKEYQYKREGEETIDTALGKIDTVIYTSQRTGSSRLTRLWLAPSLDYIPVRGEQMRKGKREFTLQIRTLKR